MSFLKILGLLALCLAAPSWAQAHSPMPPVGSTENGFGTNIIQLPPPPSSGSNGG